MNKRLTAQGFAILLFLLTITATGPTTEWVVSQWIKPGVIQTACENAIPGLFGGTLLQSAAIKSPDVLPIYGSSELSHGGSFNPTKLFSGKPTGWVPFLVGHAGTEDLIQALYAGAQNLKGKKIALSLSAQWFSIGGIGQKEFAANFSALDAYKMFLSPSLTTQTKGDLAQRLLQFDQVQKSYPVLAGLLKNYGHSDLRSRLIEITYWPMGRVELAALEIQDAVKTIEAIQHLPGGEIANNEIGKLTKTLVSWSLLEQTTITDGKATESNNPFGINNKIYSEQYKDKPNLKNSQVKFNLFPSKEYEDLNLLMRVLKDEGADPIFIIQPLNGFWCDYTGLPKAQRQKYYETIREMSDQYGYVLDDFSGHEYDRYFMGDSSHPGEKGWLEIDEALDKSVHQ